MDGLFNKMGNFFSDIIDSLKSKNVSENEINNIINMNNEESKIIRKENLEEIKPKKKWEMCRGTGKFCKIFLEFVVGVVAFLVFLTIKKLNINKNLEEFESITFFDSGILNGIKTADDLSKFDDSTKKDLALRLFKFADFGYTNRKEEKYDFNKLYLGWEIINDNLIGKDNSFILLKDPKYKRLIITFPGTQSGI